MSPLYIAAILITSILIPPTLGQGYGPLPHKGKKHRTTTTTTLPPDIASLDVDGQQYQPGFVNPVSSTPVSDNNLGSFNQPGYPPDRGSYWWQNPNSPFNGVNPPPPAQSGGCGGGGAAVSCGAESTPINIQDNPFLSGLKPGGTPPAQTVACSGTGYICAPKHLCHNGVVIDDGQGLIQVRAEVQYCDAASEVCCSLPATPNKPSGCAGYGPGGSCDVTPAPVTPFQPGLVHVTPGPSQPGLVHVPPAPSQPGLVHVPPAPSQPGLVHIPPSPKPSFPVSGGQYPSASIPSPTYSPPKNFGKPIPGTNGVPIGGSIYDVTRQPVTPAPNPSPYTGPLNTTPYPGCAAALKCVQETYCTADGVMADHPVVLTREQYENRVPLSECADPDTGVIGKCCRDPNYEDPWPGGMMMKKNGDGQQPDECGVGAVCLHSYECGHQYRIQPTRNCRVPLDGASGICCSSGQSAFPGGQPGGTIISGTTPVSQKPVKRPIPGYPQPKPDIQPFPQPYPSQPFPSQPFPQSTPSPQTFPQYIPSSPQPFPQPAPSTAQPLPHIPPSQSYPKPFPPSPQPSQQYIPSSPQPYPQPFPSQQPLPQPAPPSPQPHPQPAPPSPQPYPQPFPSYQPLPQPAPPPPQPHPQPAPPSPQPYPQPFPSYQPLPQPALPSPQPHPQPAPPSPQPYPQPSPSTPQPYPQPFPSYQPLPKPAPPAPQPYPQPSPSSPEPFPQTPPSSPQPFTPPTAQPTHPAGSAALPTYIPPVKSVPPKRPPSFPQPPSELPYRPSTGYPQAGQDCGIRRQVSRQGLSDTDAGFGEFPWQALVLLNSNHSALCSAAVISEHAVVTAAHCLHNLESSDISVEVGTWRLVSHDQPKPVHLVPVAAIARHPDFDGSSLFNDLAVLMLSTQLTFDDHIGKICLPPRGQDVTRYQYTCIATGWGKTALQANIPGSILHQIPVRLIPHSTCENTLQQTHLGRYFILNPSFQCAVPTTSLQDLCKVDIGGPIGCDRGDGHYVLSGLYSWDVGCSVPSSQSVPSVLGGIDVAWIESVLARPVDELIKEELNEILRLQQQQDLGNVDTESKPGFSQGYGKK